MPESWNKIKEVSKLNTGINVLLIKTLGRLCLIQRQKYLRIYSNCTPNLILKRTWYSTDQMLRINYYSSKLWSFSEIIISLRPSDTSIIHESSINEISDQTDINPAFAIFWNLVFHTFVTIRSHAFLLDA